MKKKISTISGFTLVEAILTIVIVGIIAGVSAKILLSGLDTYSFVVNRKDATQHARVAMDRMVSELTGVGSSEIRWTYCGNTRFSFYDKDGYAASFESGTQNGQPVLMRDEDFLAGRLGFIDFDYLKADGSPATSLSQLQRINVEVAIESLGGYGMLTLRTEVFPRNYMYTNFQ